MHKQETIKEFDYIALMSKSRLAPKLASLAPD